MKMKNKKIFSIIPITIILLNVFLLVFWVPEIIKQSSNVEKFASVAQDFIDNYSYTPTTNNNEILLINQETNIQINYIINKDKINVEDFTSEISQIYSKSTICDNIIQQKINAYKEQIRKQNILNEIQRRGNIGRLSIPSVGIDVAVFPSISQAVCDAPDSAILFDLHGGNIIGDHNYQGFGRIRNMAIGSYAYIENGNTKTKFVCTGKITNGTNTKYDLVNGAGACICRGAPGGYVLYTCNDWSGRSITIVFLQPA